MSEYYMLDSWGLKHGEPTQKPLDVDFDDWEEEWGLGEDDVEFLLGQSMKNLGIPQPIVMHWDEEIAGGGIAWELEGTPSKGPRNAQGIRRKWAYKACNPPLFHKDLITAINECGVDNLETFDVKIIDPTTHEVCEDYKAINVVGLIKAVDMSGSVATVHSEDGLGDTDFDSVKLDEVAIRGLKMFRLAESVNAIVIHNLVKEHLEAKGGFELTFTEPEKWVG